MKNTKLSAADWSFFRTSLDAPTYYTRLAELGFSAAEMVPPERRPAARAAGLDVLNLSAPGMTKGLNRLEHHGELLPELERTIREAGAEHIKYVIVFSGNRAGQPDATGIDNVARGLEQLLAVAEAEHVTLLFEMLNGHNHGDYQADSSQYGFTLVQSLASPQLRVLYDVYHMAKMGEDVLADLERHPNLIAHLHIAESPNRSEPISGGVIDYRAVYDMAMSVGYDGYFGFEWCPAEDPVAELGRGTKLFRSFASARA
jgi:hydroxypyruvate isomerase